MILFLNLLQTMDATAELPMKVAVQWILGKTMNLIKVGDSMRDNGSY